MKYAPKMSAVLLVLITTFAIGEMKKELHFTVGPKANITVINQYGPISVKSVSGNQVTITATLHSDKVEVDSGQDGNRVDIKSHLLAGANPDSGRVDYEVSVPADASVTLHSPTGPLRAEKLHGDVTLEGAGAAMDVRDVSDAHVHVNTMNGVVTLSNIQDGHVEINSVGGDVNLNDVSGPKVQVISTTGKIFYNGGFGFGGVYSLTSYSGDIEATIPSDASVKVAARSLHGKVQDDFSFEPDPHPSFAIVPGSSLAGGTASAFAGTIHKMASTVSLRSFSGKIRLKKR
jgi:DUF4097 and DUF4098 domain-containing protein YvlB